MVAKMVRKGMWKDTWHSTDLTDAPGEVQPPRLVRTQLAGQTTMNGEELVRLKYANRVHKKAK
jgi:hypothetical protein